MHWQWGGEGNGQVHSEERPWEFRACLARFYLLDSGVERREFKSFHLTIMYSAAQLFLCAFCIISNKNIV